MTDTKFRKALDLAQMKKIDLAKKLGVRPGTVYRWTDDTVPQYAWVVLQHMEKK